MAHPDDYSGACCRDPQPPWYRSMVQRMRAWAWDDLVKAGES